MNTSKRKSSFKKMIPGLLIGQVIAVIISLMVTSVLGAFFENRADWLIMIISIGFFLFFAYHEGWIAGSSDANLIKFDRIKRSPWKGALAGALASVPGFLIALAAFLAAVVPFHTVTFLGQELLEYIYRFWYMPFSFLFPAIPQIPALRFLPVIFMPIACCVGYWLGLKQISLREKVVYEKDRDETSSGT